MEKFTLEFIQETKETKQLQIYKDDRLSIIRNLIAMHVNYHPDSLFLYTRTIPHIYSLYEWEQLFWALQKNGEITHQILSLWLQNIEPILTIPSHLPLLTYRIWINQEHPFLRELASMSLQEYIPFGFHIENNRDIYPFIVHNAHQYKFITKCSNIFVSLYQYNKIWLDMNYEPRIWVLTHEQFQEHPCKYIYIPTYTYDSHLPFPENLSTLLFQEIASDQISERICSLHECCS